MFSDSQLCREVCSEWEVTAINPDGVTLVKMVLSWCLQMIRKRSSCIANRVFVVWRDQARPTLLEAKAYPEQGSHSFQFCKG